MLILEILDRDLTLPPDNYGQITIFSSSQETSNLANFYKYRIAFSDINWVMFQLRAVQAPKPACLPAFVQLITVKQSISWQPILFLQQVWKQGSFAANLTLNASVYEQTKVMEKFNFSSIAINVENPDIDLTNFGQIQISVTFTANHTSKHPSPSP